MPEMRKVVYRGRELGEVRVFFLEDWQNTTRPATDRDLLLINATSAADAVREVLEREPKRYDEAEPDRPWVTVVVREVCAAVHGFRDGRLEEQALSLYVSRHGMDQILAIWGADVEQLARRLAEMSGLDDVVN